jgi:hypothetical protein
VAALDLQQWLTSDRLIPVAAFVVGVLASNLVAVLRNRVRVLTYTVKHDRIGLSADDRIFGNVRVSWSGAELANLWMSTITLDNQTTKDYSRLQIIAYTGEATRLLSVHTSISKTPHIVVHTDAFAAQIAVPDGAVPTAQQWDLYYHRREYRVPVFNRGQQVELKYLTTVTPPAPSPAVWLDAMHEGVRFQYLPNVPRVHGVPVTKAVVVGLVVCIAIVVLASLLATSVWEAAIVCMVAGLGGQQLGAYGYRVYRILKDLILR